jgi:Protein of unknown function (DUF1566)
VQIDWLGGQAHLVAIGAFGVWAYVRITTDPGDAQIFINGQRKGNSPSQEGQSFAIKLPQGEYTVEARKSDGKDYYGKKSVYVANDSLQTVDVKMEKVNLPPKPYGTAANGSTVVNGLEWLRCSVGQQWTGSTCTGAAKAYTFEETKTIASTFNATGYGGKRDWRMPTVRELQTLRMCSNGFKATRDLKDGGEPVPNYCNDGSSKPTIDTARFPQTPSVFFWSSSECDANDAWCVNFHDGSVGHNARYDSYAVRLVRASQ